MSIISDFSNLKAIQKIAKKNNVKVFLVGGFLRDYLIKRPCFDLDFAVERNGIKIAKQFAKEIKGAFVLLDEERGCARVVRQISKADLARSRHTMKTDGGPKKDIVTFDFADFRAKTLKDDLSHRDFTINTLTVDIKDLNSRTEISDVLLDYKRACKDIKEKRIKMTSVKSFKEDPLRVLRAFSLRATLGFKVEQKTLTQIKKDRSLLRDVSYERIREEFFKVLSSDRASQVLKEMDKAGILKIIMPQIEVMHNVKQGTYHHLDVWPHSLETVVQLEKIFKRFEKDSNICEYLNEELAGTHRRSALIKLAALLHDIGKPDSKRKEQKRTIFHGHERIGRGISRSIAKMMKLSTKERHALEDMVLWHLRPGYLSNFKRASDRAVFRFFRDAKDEAVSIVLLSLADQKSTRGPLTTERDQRHHEKVCMNLLKRYFDKKAEKPFVRIISGDDLIKRIRLKPSPIFKKILSEIEEKQATGKIKTKSQALALARKIAKK